MKFTNTHNLPEAVFRALSKNRYSGSGVDHDYSATTLLKPPRIVMLERRHAEEIEEDVIDRLWSMFGSIAHTLLEEHCSDAEMSETRFFATFSDRTISGQIDSFHPASGILTDYKVTSAWTIVYGSRVEEWAEQLNIYAYLLEQAGHKINGIQIATILRDWDKHKALAGGDYPSAPVHIVKIPIWADQQQCEFISGRVTLMITNEKLPDDDLTPCSSEEMWEKPTVFAVHKEGRKSAVKLFEDFTEAGDFCANAGKGHSVVTRPGKRTRCEDGYCSVAAFCNQFQEYKKTLVVEE